MKITQTKTGGILSWGEEDWLTGLQPYFQNVSHSINSNNSDGLSWATGMDPYYMIGSLWPSTKLSAMTNNSVIDAVQKNAITNGDQAYSVGGTKIHNFSALTGTLTNGGGTFPKTVAVGAALHAAHSTIVMEDIVIYYISTTKYAFYSWSDNTDGDVGRYNLSTTFYDDWLSNGEAGSNKPANFAVLDTTNPHPLVVGDDDILYIGDGRNLHRFDGQTGTYGTLTKNKLQLPLGSIITSFSKIENFLVIYAYKPSTTAGAFYKSEVKAYFWDYVSEDPTYSKPIQGNYINGGFTYKGQPGCFVQGVDPSFKSQRGGKLVLFNGSQFEEVCSFPESIPGHGGVETVGNVIRWNSDGVIYQYGSLFKYPSALNRLLVSAGTTGGGMLKNLALNYWFVSAGTTTSGGLEATLSGGWYTSSQAYVGLTLPPFPLGYKGMVTAIKVFWRFKYASNGSKAKISLIYQDNAADNATKSVVNNNTVTPTTKLVDEYQYAVATNSTVNVILPTFSQIGWQLTYEPGTSGDQPDVIQRIEIHYEHIKA